MRALKLAKVCQLPAPGPVVLPTTARNGHASVMALQAWTDPRQQQPKTLHHQGYGRFTVDGATIKLKSGMR